MNTYPDIRMRRLRLTETSRKMFGAPLPGPEKFLWPVFVIEGQGREIPIASMPGQFRYSIDRLERAVEKVAAMGIGGLMIFGVIDDELKNATGSYSGDENGLVQRAVRQLRKSFPDLLIFTDVCLCGYTSHGHCAPLAADGGIMNDAALSLLADAAVSHARAGAQGVAPSAMMDGQVAAIRKALVENSFHDTLLMSYSTKFASSMYGPFRDAADSAPGCGDRKSYQLPYNDRRQALRESLQDEVEGADILMVKPALFYLDIISELRERTELPLAAYNVSGEYSMIQAAAANGWGDLRAMARESIAAINRSGADVILSYWSNQYDELFKD
ncbi:MAG: porphobilinogen synthase [Victivallaceae bacterium]